MVDENKFSDDSKDFCKNFLKNLTNSNHLCFTKRGNESINIAIDIAKDKGYNKLVLPRDGSWIHYPIVGRKKKLEVIYLETSCASINLDELKEKLDDKSIFLYHSNSGYFKKQDVNSIYDIAKNKKSFLIMDVCGSLGLAFYDKNLSNLHSSNNCDLLVSSLRHDKPVDADGGFVATNNLEIGKILDNYEDYNIDYDYLKDKLLKLEKRIIFLTNITKKHSKSLFDLNVKLLNDNSSLVIIALFSDLKTKERIINYCEMNKLEYEVCPREIRVLCDAISIEIKRLREGD